MTPQLLGVLGAVFARHGVSFVTCRLATDEVGVAHVRVELETLGNPLPKWLLSAIEFDLKEDLSLAAAPPAATPASLVPFSLDAALGPAPAPTAVPQQPFY